MIKRILIEETKGFEKVIVYFSKAVGFLVLAVAIALSQLDISDLTFIVEEKNGLTITAPIELLRLPRIEGGKLNV